MLDPWKRSITELGPRLRDPPLASFIHQLPGHGPSTPPVSMGMGCSHLSQVCS